LELFAHEVVLYESAALPYIRGQYAGMPGSCALAFQFLDYPTLLLHASEAPEFAVAAGVNAQIHRMGSGKSCVIQAVPEELAYLLNEVCFNRNRRRVRTPIPSVYIMPLMRFSI